jgi:hypothetical protein
MLSFKHYVYFCVTVQWVLEIPKIYFMLFPIGPYHLMGYIPDMPVSESPVWWLLVHLIISVLLLNALGLCLIAWKNVGYRPDELCTLVDVLFFLFFALVCVNSSNLGGLSQPAAICVNLGINVLLLYLWYGSLADLRRGQVMFVVLSLPTLGTFVLVSRWILFG